MTHSSIDNEGFQLPDFCLRTAAKLLQFSPKEFIRLLAEHKYIFKSTKQSAWEAYQKAIDNQILKQCSIEIKHNSGLIIPHPQVRVTVKGLKYFKEHLKA